MHLFGDRQSSQSNLVDGDPLSLPPAQAQSVGIPGSWLWNEFLGREEASNLLHELIHDSNLGWRQRSLCFAGREVAVPRLTAWVGSHPYTWSGHREEPAPWGPLCALRARVEQETGHHFNGAMLNLYRSGEDSISWHADDEPELGPTSAVVIASVSLGVTRRFQLRRREEGSKILSIDLSSGSLLFLGPGSQSDWLHRVSKSPSSPPNPAPLFTNPTHQRRVNITFRRVSS